eukprot:scaffold840_cov344-Pavlova_lutheri.AAC.83
MDATSLVLGTTATRPPWHNHGSSPGMVVEAMARRSWRRVGGTQRAGRRSIRPLSNVRKWTHKPTPWNVTNGWLEFTSSLSFRFEGTQHVHEGLSPHDRRMDDSEGSADVRIDAHQCISNASSHASLCVQQPVADHRLRQHAMNPRVLDGWICSSHSTSNGRPRDVQETNTKVQVLSTHIGQQAGRETSGTKCRCAYATSSAERERGRSRKATFRGSVDARMILPSDNENYVGRRRRNRRRKRIRETRGMEVQLRLRFQSVGTAASNTRT